MEEMEPSVAVKTFVKDNTGSNITIYLNLPEIISRFNDSIKKVQFPNDKRPAEPQEIAIVPDSVPEITGYKFENTTGSCYNFHVDSVIWIRAMLVCNWEGGYLVVINNQEEAEAMKRLFNEYPAETLPGKIRDEVHVGLFDFSQNGDFRTITNYQPLSELGFRKWGANEPNPQRMEYCMSFHRDGSYHDIKCDTYNYYNYICERPAHGNGC